MESIKEKKKVLLGWPILNINVLLAGNDNAKITPELATQIQAAVNSVEERVPYVNPTDVISEPSDELNEYFQEFWLQPEVEAFRQEG